MGNGVDKTNDPENKRAGIIRSWLLNWCSALCAHR